MHRTYRKGFVEELFAEFWRAVGHAEGEPSTCRNGAGHLARIVPSYAGASGEAGHVEGSGRVGRRDHVGGRREQEEGCLHDLFVL